MSIINIFSHPKQLAESIAATLNDLSRVDKYLIYCHKYPVSVISRALEDAQATPQKLIKKSRGHLFLFLAKRYAHEPIDYSCH